MCLWLTCLIFWQYVSLSGCVLVYFRVLLLLIAYACLPAPCAVDRTLNSKNYQLALWQSARAFAFLPVTLTVLFACLSVCRPVSLLICLLHWLSLFLPVSSLPRVCPFYSVYIAWCSSCHTGVNSEDSFTYIFDSPPRLSVWLSLHALKIQQLLSGFNKLTLFTAPNGCGDNNGGCDVICMPLPGNSSKCACPDGYHLSSDMKTCSSGMD